MKPILLKMKAFGPYAKETIVDFTKLKSSLYLITGDTGAGKTTIFDAMTFALYGVASGSKRDPSMMHSDFVGKDVDSYVELKFEHNNKEYVVSRTIHYAKQKGTDKRFAETPTISATLKEPNKNVIDKKGDVNDRIEEILGLDAKQFKQIIVLAQGEFKEFLQANSDEKGIILGKLFDNTPYKQFEETLKDAVNQINAKIAKDKDEIHYAMDIFDMPDGLDEEEEQLYYESNPNLVENIHSLIDNEKIQIKKLEESKKKINGELDSIKEKKALAEKNNEELKKLEEYSKKKKELEDQKEELDLLKEQLKNVELAVHNIIPIDNELESVKESLDETEKDLTNTTEKFEKATIELKEANKEEKQIPKLEKENDQLKIKISESEKLLESYSKYEDKLKEFEKSQIETEKLEDSLSDLKNTIKTNKDTQVAIEKDNSKLKVVTESLDKKDNALKDLNDKKENLEEIISNIEDISSNNEKLKEIQKDKLKLLKEKSKCDIDYSNKYDAFINGQANRLASDLKEEIEKNNSGICKVCGTKLIKSDIPHLSLTNNELVTEEEVNEAKISVEEIDGKVKEIEKEESIQTSKIDEKEKNVIQSVKKYGLKIETYDDIKLKNLSKEQDVLEASIEKAKQEFNEAKYAKQKFQQNEKLLNELKETIDLDTEKENTLNSKLTELKSILASKKTEVEMMKKEFKGKDIDEIEEELSQSKARNEEILKSIDSIRTNLNKTKEIVTSLTAQIEQLKKAKEKNMKEVTNTENKLDKALKKCKFDSYDNYKEVLEDIDEDYDEWIDETKESISEYDNEVSTTNKLLETQLKSCKNIKYVDVEELEDKLELKQNEFDKVDEQKNILSNLCDKHCNTLKVVKEKKKAISKYEPAYEKLKKLSDLANGSNADGGKLTFDRYAMGSDFEEILHAANARLNIMSGGKYELVHQMKAKKKNSAAGLDIDVRDTYTGEQRKTESLSGGEIFQVSMSLALGLSDVVQAHANGNKIESMYIDEGFGSLDDNVLDKAMEVLQSIATGNRQVGIISHVSKLEENIEQKIVVTITKDEGSKLEII